MIDKTSNQGKMSIFDILQKQSEAPTRSNEDKKSKTDWAGELSNREPEMKSSWRKSREEQKKAERDERFEYRNSDMSARHLKHNSFDVEDMDFSRNAKSVRSARSGGENTSTTLHGMSDNGGSSKMVRSGKNSIFDPNVLVAALNAKSSREKTRDEKMNVSEKKAQIEEQYRLSKLPPTEGDNYAFMNKSSILKAGKFQHNDTSNGQRRLAAPSKNISMFDNHDFEHLKDTDGERIQKKAENLKEERKPSKAFSTRDIQNTMFDRFEDQTKQASDNANPTMKYGNARQNSSKLIDRLIDILNKKSE